MFKSVLMAITLIYSCSVNSALIPFDWRVEGDSLLVHDTTTSLNWVRLDQTTGKSYNYITSQFGEGGEFEGMRYATLAETQAMFSALGLPITSSVDPDVINTKTQGIINLFYLFGVTNPYSPYHGSSYGQIESHDGVSAYLLGAAYYENTDPFNLYPLGQINKYMTGLVPEDPYPVTPRTRPLDYISQNEFTGSYLVTLEHLPQIPNPAAVWLFSSGLIGLIGMARRKA